jgi:hypothetical protein
MQVRESVLFTADTRQLIHETYAGHYILTNLGIDPSEVFVLIQRVANVQPVGSLFVIMSAQRGFRTCNIPVSHVRSVKDGKRFEKAWIRFHAEDKPKLSDAELDRIVHDTTMWRRRVEVITALVHKGFVLTPGEMIQ